MEIKVEREKTAHDLEIKNDQEKEEKNNDIHDSKNSSSRWKQRDFANDFSWKLS